ncbi:glycoside hydrolase family 76 protein [Thermophagus sp. OGC60D27]|uniref:glycoside hydrolase family 76 protein n=1 Tax=Thermophagus sp. OGC60D27 TaxID=3458415 RepID=UPI00403836F8
MKITEKWTMWKVPFLLLWMVLFLVECHNGNNPEGVKRAQQTMDKILKFYDAHYHHLFNESFPPSSGKPVSYLVEQDSLAGRKVAFLWPTSGLLSAVNALIKRTGSEEYERMLREIIVPNLENYYDEDRVPPAYQSYIVQGGESDRYYDDNIWLALDFLEAYHLTNDEFFLEKSKLLWKFILSGWDDKLGGGIYWCEQKKYSKNTCSNAPASVLGLKLFEATRDSSYFLWGIKIYEWVHSNLKDTVDGLYYDNLSVQGSLDERKFTYNTGQMLQAASLIYKLTDDKAYLNEAEKIAESAMQYFTEEFKTAEGKTIRLFKSTDNWFNVIMYRGYEELYQLNHNPEYIQIFLSNLDYLWKNGRDKNGLFRKGWMSENSDQSRWLLDQACMVEIYASISKFE